MFKGLFISNVEHTVNVVASSFRTVVTFHDPSVCFQQFTDGRVQGNSGAHLASGCHPYEICCQINSDPLNDSNISVLPVNLGMSLGDNCNLKRSLRTVPQDVGLGLWPSSTKQLLRPPIVRHPMLCIRTSSSSQRVHLSTSASMTGSWGSRGM